MKTVICVAKHQTTTGVGVYWLLSFTIIGLNELFLCLALVLIQLFLQRSVPNHRSKFLRNRLSSYQYPVAKHEEIGELQAKALQQKPS